MRPLPLLLLLVFSWAAGAQIFPPTTPWVRTNWFFSADAEDAKARLGLSSLVAGVTASGAAIATTNINGVVNVDVPAGGTNGGIAVTASGDASTTTNAGVVNVHVPTLSSNRVYALGPLGNDITGNAATATRAEGADAADYVLAARDSVFVKDSADVSPLLYYNYNAGQIEFGVPAQSSSGFFGPTLVGAGGGPLWKTAVQDLTLATYTLDPQDNRFLNFNGTVTAAAFAGDGSQLTNLPGNPNASSLTNGNYWINGTSYSLPSMRYYPDTDRLYLYPTTLEFDTENSVIGKFRAGDLVEGTVPLARLSNITSNQIDSATDAVYRSGGGTVNYTNFVVEAGSGVTVTPSTVGNVVTYAVSATDTTGVVIAGSNVSVITNGNAYTVSATLPGGSWDFGTDTNLTANVSGHLVFEYPIGSNEAVSVQGIYSGSATAPGSGFVIGRFFGVAYRTGGGSAVSQIAGVEGHSGVCSISFGLDGNSLKLLVDTGGSDMRFKCAGNYLSTP